jgi:hypothetical protein
MHRFAPIAFAFVCLLGAVSSARAQEQPEPLSARRVSVPDAPIMDLSREGDLEIARWLDDMARWRRQSEGSENRVAHDLNGKIIPRHTRPPAPRWLSRYCEPFGDDPVTLTGRFGEACRLLAVLTAGPGVHALQTSTRTARADREKPERSSFLSRLHLDGLWVNPSDHGRTFGLLGSHITLVDVGRVQVFGPPGVLLVLVPTGSGSREIRVGYTWGVSIRLMDLRLLAPTRNATLFVSVTKCWMAGSGAQTTLDPAVDLVGFSLAPRKHR